MNEQKLIHRITGIGLFTSLTIILQVIANVLPVGTLSISLSLFPISLCAVIYGPLAGLFVGLVEGVMVLFANGTSLFLAYNPFMTVLLCLLKTGLAGLFAGLIMKAFKNKHPFIGVIFSSIIVPLTNTGLFLIGTFLIFSGAFSQEISLNYFLFILTTLIGINFFIELGVNASLSPVLYRIYEIILSKMNS